MGSSGNAGRDESRPYAVKFQAIFSCGTEILAETASRSLYNSDIF